MDVVGQIQLCDAGDPWSSESRKMTNMVCTYLDIAAGIVPGAPLGVVTDQGIARQQIRGDPAHIL